MVRAYKISIEQDAKRLIAFLSSIKAAPAMRKASMEPVAKTVSPQVTKEIAPEGKLRAAINFGNPVLAQKDATTASRGGFRSISQLISAADLVCPSSSSCSRQPGRSRMPPRQAYGTSRSWPSIPGARTTLHSPRRMS